MLRSRHWPPVRPAGRLRVAAPARILPLHRKRSDCHASPVAVAARAGTAYKLHKIIVIITTWFDYKNEAQPKKHSVQL